MGVQINAMEKTEHIQYTEAIFGLVYVILLLSENNQSSFSINRMAILRTHQPLLQSDFFFKLSKTGKNFNKYLDILQSLTAKVQNS